MTAATVTHGKVHPKAVSVGTPGGERFAQVCQCGETFTATNAGAAGFSLSAHIKKANGLPVFAPKTTPVPAPTPVSAIVKAVEERTLQLVRTVVGASDFPVLPASLVQVPSLEYRIFGYKSIRGNEGDAFEANLQVREGDRWRTVASVDYDGWGGAYQVHFADGTLLLEAVETRDSDRVTGYDRYLRGAQGDDAKRYVDWALRMPGRIDKYDLDWDPMLVLGELVDEAALFKTLMRLKSTAFIDADGNPSEAYRTINTRDHFTAADHLRERGVDARIWHAGEWTPISQITR